MNRKIYSLVSASVIGFFVIFFDRLTKYWIMHCTHDVVIAPFLSFSLVCNRGISWGYFDGAGNAVFWLIVVITSLIVLMLAVTAFYRWRDGLSVFAETIIIAGALSNITDRIMYGAVIDFIAFHYQRWEFAIFNIADFFIVLGILIIMIRNYVYSVHYGAR